MRPRAASRLRLAGWIGSAVVHVAALATVVVVHARFSFDDPPVAWRGIELDGRFVSPPEPAASAEAISIETAAGPAADANAPPPIRPADSTPLARPTSKSGCARRSPARRVCRSTSAWPSCGAEPKN